MKTFKEYLEERKVKKVSISPAEAKSLMEQAMSRFDDLNNLLKEKIIINLDRYREIRNDINYRGQRVTMEEARQIIFLASDIILKLKKILSNKLN